jgi:hypothetical protein
VTVGSWALRSAASRARRSGDRGEVSAGGEKTLPPCSPHAGHGSCLVAVAIGRTTSKTPHDGQT